MDIVAFGDKKLVGEKNAPYLLAQKLGYNFKDLTTNTTGPQSVFRLVTKYAAQEEDFLPVIGWSNPASIQLRKVFKKEFFAGFDDPNYFVFGSNTKEIEMDFQRLHKWKHILTDHHLTNIRWCNLVVSVQEFLKSLEIPYLMYNIDNSISWDEYTLYMVKHIDRTRYIGVDNPKANIKKYVKKLGYDFNTLEGQQCVANLLNEKLKSK